MRLSDIPSEIKQDLFFSMMHKWTRDICDDELRAAILAAKLDELTNRFTAVRRFEQLCDHGKERGWAPHFYGTVDPREKLMLAMAFDAVMVEEGSGRRCYLDHFEDELLHQASKGQMWHLWEEESS